MWCFYKWKKKDKASCLCNTDSIARVCLWLIVPLRWWLDEWFHCRWSWNLGVVNSCAQIWMIHWAVDMDEKSIWVKKPNLAFAWMIVRLFLSLWAAHLCIRMREKANKKSLFSSDESITAAPSWMTETKQDENRERLLTRSQDFSLLLCLNGKLVSAKSCQTALKTTRQ